MTRGRTTVCIAVPVLTSSPPPPLAVWRVVAAAAVGPDVAVGPAADRGVIQACCPSSRGGTPATTDVSASLCRP